jgi:eukaryotic-like serine/threonine-protein kinase
MKPVKNINTATRLAAARAAPSVGQVIGDRYRLEEPLERGAMGSVWRAEQIRLRAPVALKFLDPSLIGDPEMHDRFMQEARSAAAVRSVHVVQIFDYGSEGNVPYIAMELLQGENLDARLSSRGTLTPAELNKIFSEVARGIGKAHAMGVVHRDVKPGNIFIAREGEHEVTKLIDFGIAKVKADALKFTQIVGTQLGTLLGTPQYMSPEQVRGSSTVDHRTDLWALAIIACECLTGRYPFSGTTIGDLTVQICTEKPSAPSSLGPVPAGFDQWFFKGTSKKPVKRFGSVEEMAEALTKILSTSDDNAPTVAWSDRLRALPQKLELPRVWEATSMRMGGVWASIEQKSQGLANEVSRHAAGVRAKVVAWSQSERLAFARPLWSRTGLLAAAFLLVLIGVGVSFARRDSVAAPRIQAEQAPRASAPVAASPSPGRPAPAEVQAAAPAAEEVVLSALPAAEQPGLESEPLVEQQPPLQVAELRRAKSERTPASAPAPAAAPPSVKPISAAMARAAARIMQADADRARAAASATAKPFARSNAPTPTPTPTPTRPASAKAAPKGGSKASAGQSHPFDDRL